MNTFDDPVFRPAELRDIGEILDMDERARRALLDHRGGPEWLTEHSALVDWAEQRVIERSLVAEYAGAVVGYLVHELVERPGRGLVCAVDRVFVEEAAREHGCGDGLLELATEVARRAGCRAIEGNALPGDRDTKNLYERARMKARAIITAADL
ncbi:MAG: GNAT family N-acetyltransferase [Ilumatobacteraceae bacterium]